MRAKIRENTKRKTRAKYSAEQIANWFLAHNNYVMAMGDAEYISNLKLQKLLYYAQGTYLALEDKPLFNDKILAWEHGPVVEKIYHKYKHYGSNGIDEEINFNSETIDLKTREILEEVYEVFGQYSAWKLRNMTHKETPWQETKRNNVISTEIIKEYFKENYIEETKATTR